MELISQRSLSNVMPEYFKNYGFGQADAYLAINTLKFLGIIDDNGKTTDELKRFQLRGDTRNSEVQEILKVAYKRLFDVIQEPYKLSKDDLTNEFMHHYGLSRRIAPSAVSAFLKLCEFCGLVGQGSVLTRKRNINVHREKGLGKTQVGSNISKENNRGLAIIPILEGKMELRLPQEVLTKMAFGGDIIIDIKDLTERLSKFAEKYCKNN